MTLCRAEVGRIPVDYAFAKSGDESVTGLAPAHWRLKAAEKRFEKDALLELAAGGLLVCALAALGVAFDDSLLRVSPGGKPFLHGGPYFSLSHSGDVAMCAVAARPVGCDVERDVPLDEEMRREIGSVSKWVLAEADFKCGEASRAHILVAAPAGYLAAIAVGIV